MCIVGNEKTYRIGAALQRGWSTGRSKTVKVARVLEKYIRG